MSDMGLQGYKNWNVQSVFKRSDRNKYAYRIILYYEDGTKRTRLCSGFATKREAEKARMITVSRLENGTYVVNDNVKVKDFLEYWLEHDIRKRVASSNTYDTYANIVKRHIIPILGNKRLMNVGREDICRLYKDRAEFSKYIVRLVKTVMNVSLSYAVKCRLIPTNPAEGIDLPKTVESKPYHIRDIDTSKTLNMDQIMKLLEASKDTPIHMQVLFNVLMGLRRQEINGVKYSDVNYIKRTLAVRRQLGKKLIRDSGGADEKSTTKSELPLKTSSSYRELPIPDYVFEAILEERKKYEKNRSRRRSQFLDADYICCSNYGKPRSKDFHWPYYKKLLKETGLPDIRWHDLRSTYCTLLLKQDFSPKAVSKLMGHAKELITMDVYGDNANIIPEEIPELLAYMEEVMPDKADKSIGEKDVEDIVIDVAEFF